METVHEIILKPDLLCFLPSTHYPLYDFDLRATHARTLLPAALASVSFGFVLVRVRDISSKILSSVLVARMGKLMRKIGMESQVGFRWDRGRIDGLFTTYLGLSKRKEHGLETWALFIDLLKAFDSVPREALFTVLRRYGMPDHFVKVLIRDSLRGKSESKDW